MIHEFRIYKLHPGRLEAFKRRFEQVSVPLFAARGIRLLGFWEIGRLKDHEPQVCAGGVFQPAAGCEFARDDIAYLVAFDSIEQRDAAWAAWVKDPEWLEAKKASEADGPIVAEEICYLLAATEFSPMK